MEIGFAFENSGMKLVCLSFCSLGKRNVGLFQRESDGMYITARNISKEANGSYSWAWGHYFKDWEEAERDYINRLDEICQYIGLSLTRIPHFFRCLLSST